MPNPFEWSSEMGSIFSNHIDKPIVDDPRTDWSDNRSLGYPFDVIRQEVLQSGLADFSQGHHNPLYGTLTPDDKVLQFCFSNMKQHFLACAATYEVHHALLEPLLTTGGCPLLVDIGCGPGTAGLAVVDRFPKRQFSYAGVDIALAMKLKARTLLEAVKTQARISHKSTLDFQTSWDGIGVDQLSAHSSIIMLCSYFFASQSLSMRMIHSLADWTQRAIALQAVKTFLLVYMNSTNPLANRNYEVFKQLLGRNPDEPSPIQLSIEYRTKPAGPIRSTQFLHEVLRLKG